MVKTDIFETTKVPKKKKKESRSFLNYFFFFFLALNPRGDYRLIGIYYTSTQEAAEATKTGKYRWGSVDNSNKHFPQVVDSRIPR
jgi:hypothetical protein